MIAARLKECLKVLRWSEDDLAEELGCAFSEVRAWSEGRVLPPLAVAAWVEALVKAHQALPRPSPGFRPSSVQTVVKQDDHEGAR